MGLGGRFANPENHVPTLEEMRHAYAKKHGSLLEKPMTLLRFIVGENVFQQIRDSPLSSELLNHVHTILEKHRTIKLDLIAERCFPKFHENDNLSVESYALKGPSLTSFMNGVLNYIIPKDLLSSQQRTLLINFISARLTTWRLGTSLLASNESYPSLKYVVIEKEVKKNLENIWALCNNDKYAAEELLDAITAGFTHFSALYALHSLRCQVKVGMQGDLAHFYYIPTYTRIKEQCQKTDETDMAFSRCSTSTEEYPFQGQLGDVKGNVESNNVVKNVPNDNSQDTNSPPMKKIKLEQPNASSKLFPRDRPPDDIPVYDYRKVKREKFDVKLAQMETESRASNSSSSNHLSGSTSAPIDEWDEVLRSINADPDVPNQYKLMFRCLVMSNRDLRDHNRILRSQLEKH